MHTINYCNPTIIWICLFANKFNKSIILDLISHSSLQNKLSVPNGVNLDTSSPQKKNVCFNVVQKWDINLQTQDVVTLYQYQNCSSKWGFAIFI